MLLDRICYVQVDNEKCVDGAILVFHVGLLQSDVLASGEEISFIESNGARFYADGSHLQDAHVLRVWWEM